MQNFTTKISVLSIFLFAFSCSTTRILPSFEISVTPYKFDQSSSFQEQLKVYKSLVDQDPQLEVFAWDMRIALEAMHEKKLKRFRESVELWAEILSNSQGEIANIAFDNWVHDLNEVMGRSHEITTIASYFWNDTHLRNGKFAAANKWSKVEDLYKSIGKIFKVEIPADPSKKSELKDDIFLVNKANSYCLDSKKPEWSGFIASLNVKNGQLDYWQALVLDCKNESKLAAEKYSNVLPKLLSSKAYGYAFYSAKSLIRLHKYTGDRFAAANAYIALVNLLRKPDLTPQSIAMKSDYEFIYERLNMTLWAARYRSLVGDYLTAKIYVQDALHEINNLPNTKLSMNSKEKKAVVELEAEAYHIQAFRISIEEKNLNAAFLQNRIGKDLDPLEDDWKWRFEWYNGWYQYLQGQIEPALESWEKLAQDSSADWQEKSLFWLAKVNLAKGEQSNFENYRDRLLKEYPLGFYAIYGMTELNWNKVSRFPTRDYQAKLSKWDLDIAPIVENKDLELLQRRVELAFKIGNSEIAKAAVRDLYVQASSALSKKKVESFLYISRLLLVSHQYRLAMSLTYEMLIVNKDLWEEFPEQLLVFFPYGYESEVKTISLANQLNPYLVLGLIRQESAFEADATSWVGAKGLLQLMPTTAEQYMEESLKEDLLIEKLEDPLFNLKVAGKYLGSLNRRYSTNNFEICAAYNAGEFAVDRWKSVRAGSEQLIWLENIPFSETQKYVKSVLRNRFVYQMIYADSFNVSIRQPHR